MIKIDGHDRHGNVEGSSGASPSDEVRPAARESGGDYCEQLEQATRGLLELTAILERMDKSVGLPSLRALQSLRRRGPSLVTELANDLVMLVSTASRLSDRLAEAGLITRRVSPTNRRATELEVAPGGQAVLDELVAVRTAALAEVTAHMEPEHRQALLPAPGPSAPPGPGSPGRSVPAASAYRVSRAPGPSRATAIRPGPDEVTTRHRGELTSRAPGSSLARAG